MKPYQITEFLLAERMISNTNKWEFDRCPEMPLDSDLGRFPVSQLVKMFSLKSRKLSMSV